MDCSDWSEKELFRYFSYEMTPAEQAKFERHVSICSDCREEFELYFELQFHEATEEENDLVKQFLASPQWQRQKEELARKIAQKAMVSNIATDPPQYYIPKHQWPQKSQLKQQLKVQPQPKLLFQKLRVAKVAAMFILALIPFVLTYLFIFKPTQHTASYDHIQNFSENSDLLRNAANFENAHSRVIQNPQDYQALYNRAIALEQLQLFDLARKDYENLLNNAGNYSRRSEIEIRFHKLNERLVRSQSLYLSRYDRLERDIDDYLWALQNGNNVGAANALDNAQNIANEMAGKTNDKFGLDVVSCYRTISLNAASHLREARKLRLAISGNIITENYSVALEQAFKAKGIFERFGAYCDIEQIDIQIARYLNRTGKLDEADNLIKRNIKSVIKTDHLFSHAQLLLRQSENAGERSDFLTSKTSLENSIRIAESLDVPEFILNPSLMLAGIYYVTNDNEKALSIAYKTLVAATNLNKRRAQIPLSQIIGISAFNLKYSGLAEKYLETSISLSKLENNIPYLSFSHTLLGIIHAEQQKFTSSEENFSIALRSLDDITDPNVRNLAEMRATGYRARAQMLAGNTEAAIRSYARALELANNSNIRQNLMLSQLHQGLAESLIAKGEIKRAADELTIAIDLAHKAKQGSEENNTLLTFAVTHQPPDKQLQLLRRSENN